AVDIPVMAGDDRRGLVERAGLIGNPGDERIFIHALQVVRLSHRLDIRYGAVRADLEKEEGEA
ncbi:MAG: hypothetical protein LUQ45_03400, partial [Methanoregulaceae archaeon]|nr:hypothetical protein [Methanoregulaceae archaeon]